MLSLKISQASVDPNWAVEILKRIEKIMLLAYVYCFGSASERPELCITPAKPDQFSCSVRVHSLLPTDDAVCRLSPTEGIKVVREPEPNTLMVEPIAPSKFYLTNSQPDRPGLEVKCVKITFLEDSKVAVFYKQIEKDPWKPWRPNESLIS